MKLPANIKAFFAKSGAVGGRSKSDAKIRAAIENINQINSRRKALMVDRETIRRATTGRIHPAIKVADEL